MDILSLPLISCDIVQYRVVVVEAVNSTLDIEEILHLAAYAIDHQQTDKALALAKAGMDRYPESGEIAYLLGTLYAEIGMYDKAKDLLQRALPLLDNPDPAAFQLGLLFITGNQPDEALHIWQRLDHLDEDHYFRLFSRGMVALSNGQVTSGQALLEQGILNNKEIPALNRDMENVLKQFDSSQSTKADDEAGSTTSHFLLSGYAGRKKT